MVSTAAVIAVRCNPPLAGRYKRLREHGEQARLALVAVVGELVTLADILLRANRLWQPSAPSAEVPA